MQVGVMHRLDREVTGRETLLQVPHNLFASADQMAARLLEVGRVDRRPRKASGLERLQVVHFRDAIFVRVVPWLEQEQKY